MIRERYVKGPIDSITFHGRIYDLRYRRRYYRPGVHFTWIEVETSPGKFEDVGDCIQTSHSSEYREGGYVVKLKRIDVEPIVKDWLSEKYFRQHFQFVHVGN